jgi:nicotinate-nucleotide adenylyltransferase
MRVGLFGGTFNPIHFGHLRAALEVKEGFGLDQVFLIPAAVPPHKGRTGVAAAEDRLRMIELAVEGDPGLMVSDVEIKRSGPSFTIDTVRYFRQSLAADTDLFLVMGLDAFLEIDTWKSFRDLLALVPVIVLSRPDAAGCSGDRDEQIVQDFIRSKLSPDGTVCEGPAGCKAPGLELITVFQVTALDISSTRVRERVREGRSIRYLVPSNVRQHITSKGLYR